MSFRATGTVGILPVGALGFGCFHHLTNESQRCDGSVVFLDRPGSASSQALHAAGGVRVRDSGGAVRLLPATTVLGGNLVDRLLKGIVPEIVLITCNPDQLFALVSHLVEFVCEGHIVAGLDCLEEWLPAVVLCPNGIYFQRVRLVYGEKLEEAALFRRLPPLWPHHHERILSRLFRGVTMQTGVREGGGGEAVYRPGPRGLTRIAGGDTRVRARVVEILGALGAHFEDAGAGRPTRLEFEKGLINLVSNLLGQLLAIDESGRFTPMTVAEILDERYHRESLELTRHVVAVGRAVGAYADAEDVAAIHDATIRAALVNHAHVPSSLQHIALALDAGTLQARLTPTEQWLFEPLIRYARSASLDEAVGYLRGLRERVIARLRLAIARHAPAPRMD